MTAREPDRGLRRGDAAEVRRALMLEERRALLQQLHGYELVMTGLRMRARQLEKMLEEVPEAS